MACCWYAALPRVLTTVIQNRQNSPSKANSNEIFIVPAPAGCAAHNGRPGRRRPRSADGVRECVQLRTLTQPGARGEFNFCFPSTDQLSVPAHGMRQERH